VREVRIRDTLSGELATLEPREPPKVGIYACGPTVYSRIHVGNARPYVIPLLLAWALLPASAKPGAGRPFGQDRAAAAAPAPDAVRLASLVNAERSHRGLPALTVLPRLSTLAGAQSAPSAPAAKRPR